MAMQNNNENDLGFYVKKITMENYGAVTDLKYECTFDEYGNPAPIVMVGKNGCGKTLVLANIVNSIIEIKRKFYSKIPEVSGANFYRVGSKDYIQLGNIYYFVDINFSNTAYCTNAAIRFLGDEYIGLLSNKEHINVYDERLRKSGYFDSCNQGEQKLFDQNIFLYFPVDRYYVPHWLNQKNENLSFVVSENFVDEAKTDIIKNNVLQDIESWILDVFIDMYIYEQRIIDVPTAKGSQEKIFFGGKNYQIKELINQIVRILFPDGKEYHASRIGISKKGNRKIAIVAENNNGESIELVPEFQNLSSGEIMTFAIFCNILKEADRIADDDYIDFNNIRGIVLIDEIDMHLHSNFAKEIVPNLMALFPKVQFIVSSHSPFFLLGMKERFKDKCEFLTLPEGIVMSDVENFEEIQKCYELLDQNHGRLMDTLSNMQSNLEHIKKPLIITEGKTDWKHIKNALRHFKQDGKFSSIDVEFLEYIDDLGGDSKLEILLNSLAKVPQSHKIIGIFDSDDDIGNKYKRLVNFGNNVYGMCIPDNPEFPFGISIEFLYKETDIKKVDNEGRRLYFSNEFTEKSQRLKTNKAIITRNKKVVEYYKKGEKQFKIIDSDVYDENENSLALSKDKFAENILKHIAPFDNMGLDGFIPLFETIETIFKE